jgi:hypothetical protein
VNSFGLSVSGANVGIRHAFRIRLEEAINRYPTLTAEVQFDDSMPIETILQSVGSDVSWDCPVGSSALGARGLPLRLFHGILTSVEVTSGRLWLTAHGAAALLDQIERTRSYGGELDAQPVHQLAGIAGLLRTVQSKELLDVPAHQLLQYGETDWAFLLRVAATCGRAIVAQPAGLRVLDERVERVYDIEGRLLQEQSTSSAFVAPALDTVFWDVSTGETCTGPTRSRPGAIQSPLLSETVRACERRVEHGRTTVPLNCPGSLVGDVELSSRLHRGRMGRVLGRRAIISDAGPRAGDAVRLPFACASEDQPRRSSPHPLESEPLLVTQRVLDYDASNGSQPLLNRIQCAVAAAGLGACQASPPAPGLTCWLGQVAETRLSEKRHAGRVRVSFPWNARSQPGSPQSWEGVWCLVVQPCAGQTQGVLCLPRVNDWVAVVLDPASTAPPIVLGAVYNGAAACNVGKASLTPDEQRVLLWAEGGAQILARCSKDGSSLSLSLKDQEGKSQATLRLVSTGTAELTADTLQFVCNTASFQKKP